MPIQIGINENVVLTGASLDDKHVLMLTFEQLKGEGGPKNIFEQLASATVVETIKQDIRIFPPTPPKDETKTEERRVSLVSDDMNGTKAILIHFMKGYMVSTEATLDLFASIPIDANSYNQKILQKEVLEQVHLNMANQFITKMKPFIGKADQKFRLLLIRQSKDKHFPGLRKKYLDESPIWEPMEVPLASTKLAFTKYELENGFDSGAPSVKEDADKTAGGNKPGGDAGAAPMTAAAVFGG